VNEQFLFKIQEKQPHPRSVDRITGHQLWMREPFIDVLIDDVRLVQNEVSFHKDGDLPIRVHHIDIFGFIEKINIPNLEIHTLFEQYEPAPVRERTGRTRVQNHHGRTP
jgi:hypothetical protein